MEAKGLHVWYAKNSSDYAGGRTGPLIMMQSISLASFFFFLSMAAIKNQMMCLFLGSLPILR